MRWGGGVYVYVSVHPQVCFTSTCLFKSGACGGQKTALELQEFVRHLIWELGSKLRSQ